ncbi:MAG: DUF2974 domain-containing protein [Bifidobacterium sp.]|jgi:hypothetical protein|nr:DUF2974 domain-containing protein [Bifidobacterium sp.]
MGNILDYAREETRGFDERPFNAVDALVLASLAYLRMPPLIPSLTAITASYSTVRDRLRLFKLRHPINSMRTLRAAPFDGPTLAEAAKELERLRTANGEERVAGLSDPRLTTALVELTKCNPRFSHIRISAYDERFSAERQTQFAAMTMQLPDGTLAIAFQGTDDSFVGWKEDFNMAFQYPVPAQESACDYLQTIARIWRGRIVLLGHSKGGNLAVYAAMNATPDVRERIVRVYSLDGPGFPDDVVTGPQYQAVVDKVEKIVPDSAIVGMILETPEPCIVVRSDQRGIMQHLAFSWQVSNGEFELLPAIAPSSQYFNTSLNEWLRSLSREQRERSVNALFTILAASGADHLSGILSSMPRALPDMIGSFSGLSAQDRRNIHFALNLLVRSMWMYWRDRQRRDGSAANTPSSSAAPQTGERFETSGAASQS